MIGWFTGLDVVARRVIGLAAAVVALCLVLLVVSMCSSDKRSKEAEANSSVSSAQARLGEGALVRQDALAEANRAGAQQTETNTDFIQGADNADQDAGDAGRRGRLAYCERQRLRGKPEPAYCPELRRAYSAVRPPAG